MIALHTELWSILLKAPQETIVEFYENNEQWRSVLESSQGLGFLSNRFAIPDLESFHQFSQGKAVERTSYNDDTISILLDCEDEFIDYVFDEDVHIDPWTFIVFIRENRLGLLKGVSELEDRLETTPLSLDLYLYTLGQYGDEETASTLLNYKVYETITEQEGWGPIAIGLACNANTDMFSYLYEGFLCEQYYGDSYYDDWTRLAQMSIPDKEDKMKSLFDNL
jgi:hypothetical protein